MYDIVERCLKCWYKKRMISPLRLQVHYELKLTTFKHTKFQATNIAIAFMMKDYRMYDDSIDIIL